MQLSKWTLLACSTTAVVVWALYKMYRFYQSGEGRESMRPKSPSPLAKTHGDEKERDTGA